jgi:hypothetical protein
MAAASSDKMPMPVAVPYAPDAATISPEAVHLSPATQVLPPRLIKTLLITSVPITCDSKMGIIVAFLKGTEWACEEAGRARNAEYPGRQYFDLEHGEYINEVRYTQDTQVLLAVQFITSTGRASPVYTSTSARTAVPTHRYVAPTERGEIVGYVCVVHRTFTYAFAA